MAPTDSLASFSMHCYRIDITYEQQRPGQITGFGTYINAPSIEAASDKAQELAAESRFPARVELVQLFSHEPVFGLAN